MTERGERFVISAEEHGLRLDRIVRRRLPDVARRILSELFASGQVRVEGRVARKGDIGEQGLVVTVPRPPPDVAPPNPHLGLTVIAETSDWVIVDKAAGMPSGSRDGRDATSVASALLARYPAMATFGHHPREAGLVHRLDVFTSGVLLAAKREPAFAELVAASRRGGLTKEYLAIASDVRFERGTIQSELVPGRGATVAVRALEHVAGQATGSSSLRRSEYAVLERRGRLALLRITVSAAYRHQIRAQLAAVGSPIVGDRRYGSELALGRHALHASRLVYRGGSHAAPFEVESTLPEELRALLG